MNKIFIEAKSKDTSEYHFLNTIFSQFFPDRLIELITMDGVDNLFTEAILNKINQSIDEGDNILIIIDADTIEKGWGFAKRREDMNGKMEKYTLQIPFFLYPNNADDGDVEMLMEELARKDLHHGWWDCFRDYEICISGITDSIGDKLYVLPNRKAKLHTFISSQHLSNTQRKRIGRGNWLFDDPNYWDFAKETLNPLVDFLKNNLK